MVSFVVECQYTKDKEVLDMTRYDATVFDLDGTLLDTLDDLTNAVSYALHSHGFPERTKTEVRGFVGNGVQLLMDRAVPAGTEAEKTAACLETFKMYYAAHMADQTVPYPGILTLLQTLRERGCQVAVVSNKFDAAVKRLCAHYFPNLIDMAIGEGPGTPKKPNPAIVLQALKEFGVSPARAVYVGDADTDLETAKNAGIDCISVTWGFRDRAFLRAHGAVFLASSPEEVAGRIFSCP